MAYSTATEWLNAQYKGVKISPLGEKVALFLDKIWGIHNLNRTSLGKVNWSNDTWIEIVINEVLATVDNNYLTHLVFLAHHMMLRVELRGCGPGYIMFQFHQRAKRDRANSEFWEWCPTIEEHIRIMRTRYPKAEEVTNGQS